VARISILSGVSVAEATVEVRNRLGLHLRAASTLTETVNRFKSAVTLTRGKNQVNARSVTSLMMLGAGIGTKLKLRAEGDDAREAVAAVKELFEARFGED
jgi:phosphocarrier protein HPr